MKTWKTTESFNVYLLVKRLLYRCCQTGPIQPSASLKMIKDILMRQFYISVCISVFVYVRVCVSVR